MSETNLPFNLSQNEDDCVGKIKLLHAEIYTLVNEKVSLDGALDPEDVVSLDPVWLRFIKPSRNKNIKTRPQFAFSIALMKDGNYRIFQDVRPDYAEKPATHSEEILIGLKDEFLLNNGKKVERLLIYTYNSPCLKGTENVIPCMFQLSYKAYDWHKKYGVITDVAFTKNWGLSGPHCLRGLSYSTISRPKSVFYPCFEECKLVAYKLDPKKQGPIFKNSEINKLKDSKNKKQLHKDIQFARRALTTLAENSFGLYQSHLDFGNQMITSFTFPSEVRAKVCEILRQGWKELVDKSFEIPIPNDITEKFNRAVVELLREELKSSLGNSSPVRLHRVHQMLLSEEFLHPVS